MPDESKDGRYWEKRGKNNVAARRSREARRLKENQIALRLDRRQQGGQEVQGESDRSQVRSEAAGRPGGSRRTRSLSGQICSREARRLKENQIALRLDTQQGGQAAQ